MSLQWGLTRYPELKKYATEKLIELGIQSNTEKSTHFSYDDLSDEEKRTYDNALDLLRSIPKGKTRILNGKNK